MKSPLNKSAVRKAGGPAYNPVVKTTGTGSIKKPVVMHPERKWEVEDATRVLMRADELRKDTKLMGDVKRYADEQAAKMKKIC